MTARLRGVFTPKLLIGSTNPLPCTETSEKKIAFLWNVDKTEEGQFESDIQNVFLVEYVISNGRCIQKIMLHFITEVKCSSAGEWVLLFNEMRWFWLKCVNLVYVCWEVHMILDPKFGNSQTACPYLYFHIAFLQLQTLNL